MRHTLPVTGIAVLTTMAVTLGQESEAANESLWAAARDGDTTRITAALAQGADVNARARYDVTPLILATGNGRLEAVKLLLSRGSWSHGNLSERVADEGQHAPVDDADLHHAGCDVQGRRHVKRDTEVERTEGFLYTFRGERDELPDRFMPVYDIVEPSHPGRGTGRGDHGRRASEHGDRLRPLERAGKAAG